MESEMSVQTGFVRRLGLMAAALLVGQVVCGAAYAQGGERGGAWLRSYAGASERPAREAAALAAEPSPRRQETDDSRNPRRWSSEERQQLRRDVHDAGRDVYGAPPRRTH